MPPARRKTSAVLRSFEAALDRLLRYDAQNQRNFSSFPKGGISRHQLNMLTESIFFAAFREYEIFIREVFLLFCLEKPTRSNASVKSYLKPKDAAHAEHLLQASMRYLDWDSPDLLLSRSELYLHNGFPLKLPYTTNLQLLKDMRYIRNRIAHSSKESLADYTKALKRHYKTIPPALPSPGEFLLRTDPKHPTQYLLVTYIETLRQVACAIA